MKKETPHSEKRGAGLADGWKTVAPVAGMPTTGRTQRQKRSPIERSAGSGTLIQVSQVALTVWGGITPPDGSTATARLRPAGSFGDVGTALPFLAGAVRPCLQLGLSPTSRTSLNNYDLRYS